ncbi:hypothetical protein SKAU_G00363260 [Synaphobranchus kaupii]|uniref:Uncharacterized protein n=1 Tax=Synaphobranchus kaupii TaxID=118154 RepID=A0A9Q1IGB2_SYNKA|nr:hypothetical protein SKAU_G00363260 [Synaphobranchus kaupii]
MPNATKLTDRKDPQVEAKDEVSSSLAAAASNPRKARSVSSARLPLMAGTRRGTTRGGKIWPLGSLFQASFPPKSGTSQLLQAPRGQGGDDANGANVTAELSDARARIQACPVHSVRPINRPEEVPVTSARIPTPSAASEKVPRKFQFVTLL